MKTILLFALLATTSPAWADEPIKYAMTGTNAVTQEQVIAHMTANGTDGQLSGVVHDRYFTLAASGCWTGKGMATVKGGGNTYLLEVTP